MNRQEKIKTIIELHNFFTIEFGKQMELDNSDNIWNIELLEVKPDRYYLVESLSEVRIKNNDNYDDNKTYKPSTEVRYLLRSKEAAKYGDKHQAFYDRYLNTIAIKNEYLTNPQGFKDEVLKRAK